MRQEVGEQTSLSKIYSISNLNSAKKVAVQSAFDAQRHNQLCSIIPNITLDLEDSDDQQPITSSSEMDSEKPDTMESLPGQTSRKKKPIYKVIMPTLYLLISFFANTLINYIVFPIQKKS